MVFPTHVGMNREVRAEQLPAIRIPHTRGDEPRVLRIRTSFGIVFPTHVGMNRQRLRRAHRFAHVFPTHVGMNRMWQTRPQSC